MNFNSHSDFKGFHAILSPSKYHWINYSYEKMETTWKNAKAIELGVELHDIAAKCIRRGIKVAPHKVAFNQYVNDAIGFRMLPEVVLFYSPNAFGTADCISFRDGILRIHDLKTGASSVSMRQLEVYAALFCLEYSYNPEEIEIILRIYQSDVLETHSDPEEIRRIMNVIVDFDKLINKLKEEVRYE